MTANFRQEEISGHHNILAHNVLAPSVAALPLTLEQILPLLENGVMNAIPVQ
jgi:hypothetical protein